jgi:hypothetical protein
LAAAACGLEASSPVPLVTWASRGRRDDDLRQVIRLLGHVELGAVGVEEVGDVLVGHRDLRIHLPA